MEGRGGDLCASVRGFCSALGSTQGIVNERWVGACQLDLVGRESPTTREVEAWVEETNGNHGIFGVVDVDIFTKEMS